MSFRSIPFHHLLAFARPIGEVFRHCAIAFSSDVVSFAGMRTESAAGCGPDQTPEPGPRLGLQRRVLWLCVFAWTLFVGLALCWLLSGNGRLSLWFFQDGVPNEPGLSGRVQAIFRGEFGLQRIYPWLLFGPFVALVAWHFPLEAERWRTSLALNAAACFAFVSACQALTLRTSSHRPRLVVVNSDYFLDPESLPNVTNESLAPGGMVIPHGSAETEPMGGLRPVFPPAPPHSRKFSLRSATMDLLAYGAVIAVVHALNFYGRLRERERRALFLESNLATARLNALQSQLQPHFLFNSLNAVTALLRRDPRQAETTLVALSELLRLALSQSEKQELALREELEFVQRYLEIQQTRFAEKLSLEQEIEPAALNCLVPTLVLQPLVENAIRHGIEPAEKPGVLRLSASRQDKKLVLSVEDNGVGFGEKVLAHTSGESASETEARASGVLGRERSVTLAPLVPSRRTGIGLSNLRERLRALYGSNQKFELTSRAAGGVLVRLEIPWRESPAIETTA